MSRQNGPRHRISALLICLSLALLVALIYGQSLSHQLVWDDEEHLVYNPALRQPLFAGEWLASPSAPTRLLTNLSFAIEYRLWGLHPAGYHATNLVLHVANSLLVAFLVLALSGGAARLGAWAAGLLFAVHPVTVEAVNSIALGRGYLLATLFGLAAARLAVAAVGPAGRRWLWAVAIVSLGALFSHEIGAAAIGFMVVVWLAADEHRQPLLRHAARGALTVTALLIALLLAWVASDASLPHGVIATAATVSALSVKQLLAPVTLCLWFDAAAVGQPAALGPAAGVAMIAAIILIGFTYREGGRLRLLSVLLVLVALAPVLVRHLLPFPLPSVLGERWLYLPAAFVAVWVGLLAQPWWEARRDGQGLRRRFVAALLLALLCLAGVSGAVYGAVQSRHWRDNVTLFAHAVQHCPASAYLHAALGKAYFDQKEMESAREQFQSAAAIDPTFARARIGLGLVALERGQLIGALRELSSAIALAPNDADAHNSLGELYLQLRRGEAALHEFQQAVALRPWHVVYRSNLAVAYAGVGRVPEAITQWEQVLTMSPDPAEQEAARRRIDQLR